MDLTLEPEIVLWPETHYVFVEKVGPFMTNAPAAWGDAHSLLPELLKRGAITGYMSLYQTQKQVYRAGFAVEAPPSEVPAGLSYEKFAGGKYSKFVLTGPYTLLPQATGRVFERVAELEIAERDGYCIENYVSDPRVTPAGQLVTEILVPTV